MGSVPFYQIHINRTGGSTVADLLQTPTTFETAKNVRQRLGVEEWERLYTFAFVRNPWDRFLSIYLSRQEKPDNEVHKSGISFEDFAYEALVRKAHRFYNRTIMFAPCWRWVSAGDKLLVNEIFRYEEFHNAVMTLLRQLEISRHKPYQGVAVPHHKRTRPETAFYHEYYTDAARRIVRDHFIDDITHFGYAYDTADNQNGQEALEDGIRSQA